MAYSPNVNEVDRPTNGDLVQIPEELRALKVALKGSKTDLSGLVTKKQPRQNIHPAGNTDNTDITAVENTIVTISEAGVQTYVCTGGTVNWTFNVGNPAQEGNEMLYFTLRIRNGGTADHVFPAGSLFQSGLLPDFSLSGVDYLICQRHRPEAPWEIIHAVRNLIEIV